MSALRTLGRMLGLTTEPDYDILYNERAARLALSRRNLLLAAGALTVGRVLVPVSPLDPEFWDQDPAMNDWANMADMMAFMAGAIRRLANRREILDPQQPMALHVRLREPSF